MSIKLFTAVLVLLILFFILGVGLGAGNSNSQVPNIDVGWIQGIGRLVPAPALTFDDMQPLSPPGLCPPPQNNQLIVGLGQTCEFRMATTSTPVRRLPLRVVQGATMRFEMTQPGVAGGTQRRSCNQTINVDVYEGGEDEFALLRITCLLTTDSSCPGEPSLSNSICVLEKDN
ncbi:hypothetical protein EYB53_011335 [Candidatus Chloroploca sp. M-50]|uniref:Uncharacterized protein n=1 Tax=Candidatus Chloroploca mongolica TaxID=2528176 RepID=A0ABS4DA66_9CHLR|nr:hypothetical protein [Candidatus Chloroploca mongolica]MBP1466299.1 hypothetical protein [Candidatus Chloroploca mongolica]